MTQKKKKEPDKGYIYLHNNPQSQTRIVKRKGEKRNGKNTNHNR